MRHLPERVHARVGAPRGGDADLRAEYFLQRLLENPLDRPAVRLELPARVIGAVVFDGELDVHLK